MDWIVANKEWVFSGIGVFIIGTIITILINKNKTAEGSNSATINANSNASNATNAQNLGSGNTQIIIAAQTPSVQESKIDMKSKGTIDITSVKSKVRILFIDDQDFPVVKNLKKAGWNTDIINDVHDIDDINIIASHILFVDINGVAKSLSDEEGIGLVKALKTKYGNDKKVIIYSSDQLGDRFNQAFRVADDFLPKQADYYEFLAIVEKYAVQIVGDN